MNGADPRLRRELVARVLDELRALGSDELYFDALTRAEVIDRVSELRREAEQASGAAAERDAMHVPTGDDGEAPRVSELPVVAGYEDLRREAMHCRKCRLADGRTQVVFSDGNPNARLMVVGEAPGQREDESGRPFVGPAGQLLDLLLACVGLSRKDSVYICNVLKCRPPKNRNPLPDEIELCSPYLRRQIELVRPQAILAVGTFSAQLLTEQALALGKLRGSVYSYAGTPLVVTYHPAALLRNQSWTRATWDDLQLLRQVMDGS